MKRAKSYMDDMWDANSVVYLKREEFGTWSREGRVCMKACMGRIFWRMYTWGQEVHFSFANQACVSVVCPSQINIGVCHESSECQVYIGHFSLAVWVVGNLDRLALDFQVAATPCPVRGLNVKEAARGCGKKMSLIHLAWPCTEAGSTRVCSPELSLQWPCLKNYI